MQIPDNNSTVQRFNQSGQALVLVLLSLAVILTIVLFILSRSITDIAVSSRSEEAIRAFSAAEAGVEKALVIGSGSPTTTIGNASFSANVTDVGKGSTNFVYPLGLNSGDGATLWFVAHDSSNDNLVCDAGNACFTGKTLKVCWGNPDTSGSSGTAPAIEVSIFYDTTPGDASTVRVARAAFDPNGGRLSANSFSAPDSGGCTVGGETYQFQKTIDFSALTTPIPAGSYDSQNGLQFARVRFLYNTDTAHKLGFDVNFPGNSTLPSQGLLIDSTGKAGESNRRLSVFQGWPEVPAVFQYAIYTPGGLSK